MKKSMHIIAVDIMGKIANINSCILWVIFRAISVCILLASFCKTRTMKILG